MVSPSTSPPLAGFVLPFVLGFVALFGGSLVVTFFANAKAVHAAEPQPIAFNHRVHAEEAELECATCHPGFAHGVSSGLPTTATCALCHSEAQGESAEEARLVELLENGAQLDWRPIFRQPPHVFFSHRRHVTVAGLECARCHGDIGASTAPPTDAAPLTMEQCIGCHEESDASIDCSACHR